MSDPTRHERTRLVQALRAFGADATAALLAHGASSPNDRTLVATILSFIGGAAARDPLLQWAGCVPLPPRSLRSPRRVRAHCSLRSTVSPAPPTVSDTPPQHAS